MNITIAALEEYLRERYSGWADEQGLFIKLVEEMGETAEVINMRSGRKAENGDDLQNQLGTELADILHYVVAIAAINQIDLNEIILCKDRKASLKYHYETNLEMFLSQQEEKQI